MNRLSQLQGAKVVAADGVVLGHVLEVRSPGAAETEPTYDERSIDDLLCGRLGLLERLGWKEPRAARIPWEDVLALHGRELRVRGDAGDYRGQRS